jgi:hypothetical protein
MGVITFRIAMILTTLRLMDGEPFTPVLTCSDADFRTAMAISAVLIRHTQYVFRHLLVTSGKKPHASVFPNPKPKCAATPSDSPTPQQPAEDTRSVKCLPASVPASYLRPTETTTVSSTATSGTQVSSIIPFTSLLPEEFGRETYLHIAQSLNLSAKTADRYIHKLCQQQVLLRIKRDQYKKRT